MWDYDKVGSSEFIGEVGNRFIILSIVILVTKLLRKSLSVNLRQLVRGKPWPFFSFSLPVVSRRRTVNHC